MRDRSCWMGGGTLYVFDGIIVVNGMEPRVGRVSGCTEFEGPEVIELPRILVHCNVFIFHTRSVRSLEPVMILFSSN